MNRKKLWIFVLIIAGVAAPAFAFLGFGDIVFDPSNFEEAVQQLAQLEQQYQQLVNTYKMVENQYNQMVYMAKLDPVNMIARYRAIASQWIPATATDTYGATSSWISGINTGLNMLNGYRSATEPLGSYGAAMGNIPGDQLNRIKTNYATVELADGANLSALQTIGQMRANAPLVDSAIGNLESDSLSSDPDMNTEIAVLNKINAANVIALRNGQDANQALLALAEQQVIQAKRDRDAEARAFNQHIQFMSQAQTAMSAQSAGASAAMLSWRMP